MTIESTITAKGQTTIPREVRERLGLRPGDRVGYLIEDGAIRLVARNKRFVDIMKFLGPPPAGPKSLEEIEDGIKAAAAEAGMKAIR